MWISLTSEATGQQCPESLRMCVDTQCKPGKSWWGDPFRPQVSSFKPSLPIKGAGLLSSKLLLVENKSFL